MDPYTGDRGWERKPFGQGNASHIITLCIPSLNVFLKCYLTLPPSRGGLDPFESWKALRVFVPGPSIASMTQQNPHYFYLLLLAALSLGFTQEVSADTVDSLTGKMQKSTKLLDT